MTPLTTRWHQKGRPVADGDDLDAIKARLEALRMCGALDTPEATRLQDRALTLAREAREQLAAYAALAPMLEHALDSAETREAIRARLATATGTPPIDWPAVALDLAGALRAWESAERLRVTRLALARYERARSGG